MDYVNLAIAALNEVSGSTWIQWTQGSAVLGVVAITAILTWVVRDLWLRVEWQEDERGTLWAVDAGLQDRMDGLEKRLSSVESASQKHERMLQHMAAMREAKAAKKAKVA
jgi:hypothetical protein